MARYQFVSRPELPRFSGGAVGFLGYEAIHFFEPKVPLAERDELQLPEMIFMITGSLLIFDHRLRTLKIVANAFLDDGPLEKIYAGATDTIHEIMRQLANPANLPLVPPTDPEVQSPGRGAVARPARTVRSAQRADPTTAMFSRASSSGQSNEPRITFGRATSSRLYCHSGSNPILAATRSTAIDAFVSSILRRTCFVSRWGMTLLSLAARRRCMSG